MMNCGDGKLTRGAGTNQLPPVLRTVIGTSEFTGMPVTTGIDGHLGPPVATMKGGPRGHHGRVSLTVSRKSSSTRAHLRSGTEASRSTLKQWLSTTDVPPEHGMLLWRALTGDAKLLISHFRDEELLRWDAGQKIFDVLAEAHKHISEFEDQDDFDNAL